MFSPPFPGRSIMKQKTQDRLLASSGVAFSLVAAWQTGQYPAGSALFPFLTISGIFFCSILLLVTGFRKKGDSAAECAETINLRSALSLALLLLIYLFSMERAGFFFSSFFFVLIVSLLWGRNEGKATFLFSLFFSAGFTLFLYIVFIILFNVPLPRGFFL